MTLEQKRVILILLSVVFLLSLLLVQRMEVVRRAEEAGLVEHSIAVPASSRQCVDCHVQGTPGIVEHWEGSPHAVQGISCYDCHKADEADADAFSHYGATIATIVTPRDCGACHEAVSKEFQGSHHAAGGNILASLDNFLAETVEGARVRFDPHSPTPGMAIQSVNGFASAATGCQQCHGSKVAFVATDGGQVTVDDLQPDVDGRPTNAEALARIQRDPSGKPVFHAGTWPNTGIGRLNFDGSLGSCSACHSRHDFSRRRARQPENCGKCHLGPDHPQKEIYEESKHGVAYRDLKDELDLDGETWILGEDYSAAPTCATCHMSGHSRNGGRITHDPRERVSWNNRPPISLLMDTDLEDEIVVVEDPELRAAAITDTWQAKRTRMQAVCSHCHSPSFIHAFYRQYDDFVVLYNEKFAKPGQAIMDALRADALLTETPFDEEIEWTWFYLWHHEGRRARHGASMMAPDYAHWHGMYEVAERFYIELIPQARELIEHGGGVGGAEAVIDEILRRPEHEWFLEGSAESLAAIKRRMEERYGQGLGVPEALDPAPLDGSSTGGAMP